MYHGLPAINGGKLLNQKEINPSDIVFIKKERDRLHEQIKDFCIKNNITFLQGRIDQKIQYSKYSTIVYMWLVEQIGSFEYWQGISQQCQQLGKRILVITDNFIEFEELPGVEFFSYPELLAISATDNDIPTTTTPSKLYNCFIQRTCPVRQSWFYFLHHYDLLNRGYVSFLLLTRDSGKLTKQDLFDSIHKNYQLDQLPHFEQAYQELREKVPYRNFPQTDNLSPLILDSKYSLVLDTFALEDDTRCWFFTEKVLRTLQLPTIPLLFVQKNGMSKLRNLGFEFNSAADHLDTLSWQERQQGLLKSLVNDQVDFNFNELYNQSKHNHELLQSWKTVYNKPDFFDNFYYKALSH